MDPELARRLDRITFLLGAILVTLLTLAVVTLSIGGLTTVAVFVVVVGLCVTLAGTILPDQFRGR